MSFLPRLVNACMPASVYAQEGLCLCCAEEESILLTDDNSSDRLLSEKERGEGVTADGSQTLRHEMKKDRKMGQSVLR